MSIADRFDIGEDSSSGFGLSAGELAAAGRPPVWDRVRQIDAAIAGLQAERVQLLGRLGEEAVLQAESDVELDATVSLDRRLNAHQRSLALELAAASNAGTDAAQRQLAEAWTLTQKCQLALLALSCGEISFGHAVTIAREVADLDVLAAGTRRRRCCRTRDGSRRACSRRRPARSWTRTTRRGSPTGIRAPGRGGM